MTKELTKQELTRLAWITELRRQGHRQCRLRLFAGNSVCALGLLAEVAGIVDQKRVFDDAYYKEIAASAGLTESHIIDVYQLNDTGHTFAEIADVVEGWFRRD